MNVDLILLLTTKAFCAYCIVQIKKQVFRILIFFSDFFELSI